MICGMSYYQICWYFLIYSFGGWIVEVIFHAVTLGKVINRGFLNGPVCPVYGFGVLSVFAAINIFEGSGLPLSGVVLFLFGFVLATVVELLAGWMLDKFFHARWWDYSDKPFNFHGYICLEFSLIWGLAIVLVVRVFQGCVERHETVLFTPKYGWILVIIAYLLYFIDFTVTVCIIQGFNKKLTKLDGIRSDLRIVSDKISTYVGTRSIETAQFVGESKVQAALAKAELRDSVADKKAELLEESVIKKEDTIENLREKRDSLQKEFEELSNSIIQHTLIGQGRLLSAFPDMKHKKYPEIIQILKDRKLHKN